MQAVFDQFAQFVAELTYQARSLEPGGWLLVGIGMAAVFAFLVRPAR